MSTIKTGDVFFCEVYGYFVISNINWKLLNASTESRSITGESLDKSTLAWEFNISFNELMYLNVKYLGDNLKAARVLYGDSNRKVKEYAKTDADLTYSLKSLAKRYHSQDD